MGHLFEQIEALDLNINLETSKTGRTGEEGAKNDDLPQGVDLKFLTGFTRGVIIMTSRV